MDLWYRGTFVAVLADSAFLLAVGLVLLGVLNYRTPREERLLLERYGGAYRTHMEGT